MKKIALVFLCLFFAFPATAKTSYEVQIPVDTEAENSVAAREKAMSEAQRRAFIEVAGKLTEVRNIKKLEQLSDTEILYFIKSVGVEDEKAGGNKYKAVLNVLVDGNLLRDYLAENEMITDEKRDLLVIPVYREQAYSKPLLWEKENIWRQQWLSKGLVKFGSIQLQTAGEFLSDAAGLNAERALYMDADTYEKISNVYNTGNIYVLYAESLDNGDLSVIVKNEKNKNENSFSVYNGDSAVGEQKNFWDAAVEKTVMFISGMEREENAKGAGIRENVINAVYSYSNMKDWLVKSAAISNLPQVEGIDTKSIGGGKVNFAVSYTGSLEELWNAMQELGLSHEEADNYFVIR